MKCKVYTKPWDTCFQHVVLDYCPITFFNTNIQPLFTNALYNVPVLSTVVIKRQACLSLFCGYSFSLTYVGRSEMFLFVLGNTTTNLRTICISLGKSNHMGEPNQTGMKRVSLEQ